MSKSLININFNGKHVALNATKETTFGAAIGFGLWFLHAISLKLACFIAGLFFLKGVVEAIINDSTVGASEASDNPNPNKEGDK